MHEVTFRWTRQEHMRACRAITTHMIGGRLMKLLPGLVGALAVVVLCVGALLPEGERLNYFLGMLPSLIVLGLWVLFLTWGLAWLAARKVAKEDPFVAGDLRHSVSESGFSVKTVAAAVDLTWSHVLQVVETPEFLLYYYTKNCAYFTPKRAIPPAELPLLRASLRGWVGERARLMSGEPTAA